MHKLISIVLIFCLLIPFCSCNKADVEASVDITETQTLSTTAKELTLEEKAEIAVSKMTIEEKIGQMLIITHPGDTVNDELLNIITSVKPGGFILMADNITTFENTRSFVDKLQDSSNIPMIISIDQEGGNVQRLSELTDPSPTLIPAMKELGNTNDEELAYNVGRVMAEELRTLGINLTFAPVADILTNPDNTVIGSRSFSSDSQIVSDMAVAVAKGLEENGVTATYKHFPGHGDTTTDSHSSLPIIRKTKEELLANELIPFQNAIDNDAKLIMIGHIALPEITADNTPASLSKEIITDLLKTEMGYTGLVVTDALNMGALTNDYSYEEIYIKAINAGVDLLLMPHDPQAAVEAIKTNIDENQIDEIAKKILTFKYKNLYQYTTLDQSYLGNEEHKNIIAQIENYN